MRLREFSDSTGINHAKIKRWAREFLGPELKQQGYSRQISLFEAWQLHVASVLMQELQFSIQETQKVIGSQSFKTNCRIMRFPKKYSDGVNVHIDLEIMRKKFKKQFDIG